jgi:S-DNA-T family DNA segregation ATPase FtsK/SpoIIIE
MASRSTSTKKTTSKSRTRRPAPKAAQQANKSPSRARKASSSASKTSSTRQASKPRSSASSPVPQPRQPLTAAQRMDLAGVGLLALGVLVLLALLTSNTGTLVSSISAGLIGWVGWGAYLLPLLLLSCGAWFLLSKIERVPSVAGDRLIGVVLLFLTILTGFELLFGTLAGQGVPGGSVGSAIVNFLIRAFGRPGAVVLWLAVVLCALVLLFHFSLTAGATRLSKLAGSWLSQLRAAPQQRAAQQRAEIPTPPSAGTSVNQPSDQATVATASHQAAAPSRKAKAESAPLPSGPKTWTLPDPEDVLAPVSQAPLSEESDEDRARVIEETLRSLGTPGHIVEIRHGPTVTMFGIQPDFIETRSGRTRVRVSNIARLSKDLGLALKTTNVRIQAPVPGKGYIGVEVPNQKTALVPLLELVESPSFTKDSSLMKMPLGKDVTGQAYMADLVNMPHLLIAGTTGSGKSVCVNSILSSYLLKMTPDQLRLVLVDPKRVELTPYNGIPHLLAPVIVDPEKVSGALQWTLREMDLRYLLFSQVGVRNIEEYNQAASSDGRKRLPYLLVVIDELADLMMLSPAETQKSLIRLGQKARATGIHLILATQRPSANIVTNLIKANFPARIAFAVTSGVDSRVILDQMGAERLLGKGDMLFQPPDAPAPIRLQGAFISDDEILDLTDFWRAQAAADNTPELPGTPVFNDEAHIPLQQSPLWEELQKDPEEDPLSADALSLIRKEGRASVSMLQRRFRIGYTRAARLIEKLEEQGIVSPPNPQTGVRDVLDYGDYPPVEQD